MENEKNITTKGGAREGAGRKRELPEGTKPTYFAITEEEKLAVKKLIREMRNKGDKKMNEEKMREQKVAEIMHRNGKVLAKAAREIIDLYGGRGKGFRKAEEVMKVMAIVASKDGIQDWENDNN